MIHSELFAACVFVLWFIDSIRPDGVYLPACRMFVMIQVTLSDSRSPLLAVEIHWDNLKKKEIQEIRRNWQKLTDMIIEKFAGSRGGMLSVFLLYTKMINAIYFAKLGI